MAEEDMSKTTFVTNDGIYCYIRMPIDLKNARVEFQEVVNSLCRNN